MSSRDSYLEWAAQETARQEEIDALDRPTGRGMTHIAGEPAPKTGRWLPREEIGPPECPIMHRWTLLSTRFGKLMLHHFLPNADDRAEHDHPASFLTIVLRGGYVDYAEGRANDRLRVGSVRFRSAEHRHRTHVSPRGCWTIVLMGPKRREWGFWAHYLGQRRWLPWRDHEHIFGFGMRCPEDES
jgi:hypothetical protein